MLSIFPGVVKDCGGFFGENNIWIYFDYDKDYFVFILLWIIACEQKNQFL